MSFLALVLKFTGDIWKMGKISFTSSVKLCKYSIHSFWRLPYFVLLNIKSGWSQKLKILLLKILNNLFEMLNWVLCLYLIDFDDAKLTHPRHEQIDSFDLVVLSSTLPL